MRKAIVCLEAVLLVYLLMLIGGCGGGGRTGNSTTGSISGIVLDATTAETVNGAVITLISAGSRSAGRVLYSTTSDYEGKYILTGVPSGNLRIKVETSDGMFRPIEISTSLLSTEGVQLSPTLIPSSVTVQPTLDTQITSATVAAGNVLQLGVDTGPQRLYPFYFVTGDIGIVDFYGRFTATKPGTGTVTTQIGTLSVVTKVVVTVNDATGIVSGLILDEQGRPVPGAMVLVDEEYYPSIHTGLDGRFVVLRLEPGPHKLVISKPGYDNIEVDVEALQGHTVTVNKTMCVTKLQNLTITPSSVTLGPGESQGFVVSASNVEQPAMMFGIQEQDGGTLEWFSESCVSYTASQRRGTYHLIARSIADPTQKVVAVITVKSGSGEIIVE